MVIKGERSMGTPTEKEKAIYVFADFGYFHNERVGTIYVTQTRGNEFYSFEYAKSWLENQPMMLDPDLRLYRGRTSGQEGRRKTP